jgi:ribonucleoside-diphosphate reductase alpha chain
MTFAIQDWTELRERYFIDRYALHDDNGVALETQPNQMWHRVASTLARDEAQYARFKWVLDDWKFVPGGRILSGVGASQKVTLYNCFVIDPGDPGSPDGRDSRSGIIHTTQRMVEITARGGGVGVNWATLRPRDTFIRGVNSRSSGAVAWMSGIDHMVDKIRQGGTRTAALMYCLPDWHPDVMEFINYSFLRANHSVLVSDAFMKAVANDENWFFEFPDITDPSYNVLWDGDLAMWKRRGLPVVVHGGIRARFMWDTMAQAAARTGNPGCLFIDHAQQASNTGYFESYKATNPCGEQWLPPNGCCNLGAINLLAFYEPQIGDIAWSDLSSAIYASVEMLDRIIDVSPDIDTEVGDLQRTVRRVGLGTMGLADLLIVMGMRYGDAESREFVHRLYEFIRDNAYAASANLAQKYGAAPMYSDAFLKRPFVQKLPSPIRDRIFRHGIRNLTLVNQAPTGTTSIIAGVSSGIEPIFASRYTLNDNATGKGATEYIHPLWKREITEAHVTAGEVSWQEHVGMQAVIQRYLDNAISKTINMPRGSTWRDVQLAYQLAYDWDCKGVTVYIDGSRADALLTTDSVAKEPDPELGFDAACATGACAI